jgi:hypothetical protein
MSLYESTLIVSREKLFSWGFQIKITTKNNTKKIQVLKEHALWNSGQHKEPEFFNETSMSCLYISVCPEKIVWLLS